MKELYNENVGFVFIFFIVLNGLMNFLKSHENVIENLNRDFESLRLWMAWLYESKIIKQWPLAGEFSEFEYSPKICHFFVTRTGEFVEYWANFCDSRRRICRVLS